jgi:hypothetical protein
MARTGRQVTGTWSRVAGTRRFVVAGSQYARQCSQRAKGEELPAIHLLLW